MPHRTPTNSDAGRTLPHTMPIPPHNSPPRSTSRETTAAMVANIGRELDGIEREMERCRGDREAEPRLTGSWMAHLLISSSELLHSLLIDTARRPGRIAPKAPEV